MISKEAIPLIMLKLLHISIIYLVFLKIIDYFLLPQWNNSIGELILLGREEPNHSQWPRPPCTSAVLTGSISNGSTGALTHKGHFARNNTEINRSRDEGGNPWRNQIFLKSHIWEWWNLSCLKKIQFLHCLHVSQQRTSKSSIIGGEKWKSNYISRYSKQKFSIRFLQYLNFNICIVW